VLEEAKLPILMWFGVFALAYVIILPITLDENNVQLICMRVLAGLCNWVALDNLKQVDLRMPDDSLHRTIMGYFPYVPEVARAWDEAILGAIGSAMIASCATVSLAIWYVDFSRRRGKAMVRERHERCAMLASAKCPLPSSFRQGKRRSGEGSLIANLDTHPHRPSTQHSASSMLVK
jgi:hypothetical protein